MLLNNGAYVNGLGGEYGNTLQAASEREYVETNAVRERSTLSVDVAFALIWVDTYNNFSNVHPTGDNILEDQHS